jgi:hypothetical protein
MSLRTQSLLVVHKENSYKMLERNVPAEILGIFVALWRIAS